MSSNKRRCKGTTKIGGQCKRSVLTGNGFCRDHKNQTTKKHNNQTSIKEKKVKETFLSKYLILDIETTGIGTFRPPKQRPIEISWKAIDQNNKEQKYSTFVKGVEKIDWNKGKCPYSVKEVNEKGRKLEDVVSDINSIVDNNTIIVGHNVEFDLGCINCFSDVKIKKTQQYDTMKKSVNICKLPSPYKGLRYKYPKLGELASHFNIDYNENKAHRGQYDVEITEKCFFKLKPKASGSIPGPKKTINTVKPKEYYYKYAIVGNREEDECPFCNTGPAGCHCGYYDCC